MVRQVAIWQEGSATVGCTLVIAILKFGKTCKKHGSRLVWVSLKNRFNEGTCWHGNLTIGSAAELWQASPLCWVRSP